MGRGFLRGVIWGVVAATATLVVLSQIGPPPRGPLVPVAGGPAPVADGATIAARVPPETAAPAAVPEPAAVAEAPPAPVLPTPEVPSASEAPSAAPDTAVAASGPEPSAAPAGATLLLPPPPAVLAEAPKSASLHPPATDAVAPARRASLRPPTDAPVPPVAPSPGGAGARATAAAPPAPAREPPVPPSAVPPRHGAAHSAPVLPAPDGAADVPPAPAWPAPVVLAEVAPPAADGPPPPPLTPEEAALVDTAPGVPEEPPIVIAEADLPALPAAPSPPEVPTAPDAAGLSEPPAATDAPGSLLVPAGPSPEAAPPAVTEAPPQTPAVLSRSEPLPSAAGLAPAVPGVTTGRLPRIGAASPSSDPAAVPADAGMPLQRHARRFDNPAAKPVFAVVLVDTGGPTLDRAALAALPFPVTFALDPTAPGAGLAATIYRAAGQEVVMLATGIPEGATAGDLEQTFAAHAAALPEAVAVMDPETGGFQSNRALAAQVVPIVKDEGRGVLSWDRGLNAASQVAQREGVANGVIFRRLDGDDESEPIIRRYLDRAAFKAAQDGRVIVTGETRPETVAALLAWAVEGRAATVALAPLSAALRAP